MAEKLAVDGGPKVRTKPWPRWPIYGEEEIALIAQILRSGNTHFVRSTVSKDFEKRFAEWNGSKHAICCNSGTSAIHMALAAGGVGPGDEVIVPPRTFIGTVSPVLYQNAVPIFADIDPVTHNISPAEIRKVITERTKAIIPVHLAGLPCDMDAIMAIAKEHNLLVVEDAAQAHGAEYKERKVGTIGHVNAFSMQDSKILNTTGDGGMVTTDNDEYAVFCREFRNHGFLSTRRHDDLHIYIHPRMGYNYRMTEIQAAVGLKAMARLDGYIETRRANAAFLTQEIKKIEGLLPMAEPPGYKCTYYRYYCTMELEKFRVSRDQFVRALVAEGVMVGVGTSAELYLQEFFQKKTAHSWDPRIYKGNVDYTKLVCPVARKVGQETFTIEVAPPAALNDMADVVAALQKVAGACRRSS
jgi:dTDP-4-amino-4,6-dideoxygalactose transaminase